MLKLFAKYTSIGVINTLIHWVVFSACIFGLHKNQALANFSGFVVAVSFSFFANAKEFVRNRDEISANVCNYKLINKTSLYSIRSDKDLFIIDFKDNCK